MSQIAVEQEIVEDYTYTDKKGNRDTVQIAIMSNCDRMTATIEFKDAAQYENFTCPAWITPI